MPSLMLTSRCALFQLFDNDPSAGWMRILLNPFVLQGERVETEIRLDGIEGVDARLQSVAGQRLVFPSNPEPGYIDGSVYVIGRHRVVDVHELEFGEPGEHGVPLVLRGNVDLQGLFGEAPMSLTLATSVRLPLSTTQMEEGVIAVIQQLGLTGLPNVGRVMAQLRPVLLYESEPAAAAAIARRLLQTGVA